MANSYTTGTVSVTNGSTAVTGAGTAFSLNAVVGGFLQVDGDTRQYEIIAAPTPTSITLDKTYSGTTGGGKTYRIFLTSAQAASNITINQQLGVIISKLVSSAPNVQALLDATDLSAMQTAMGVSPFIKTLLDDLTQSAALATLGANNASNLTSGSIGNALLDQRIGATAKSIADFNLAVDNGYYISSTAAPLNAPAATWIFCHTFSWGAVYLVQEAVEITTQSDADTRTWRRQRLNGTWSGWTRVRKSETELRTLFPSLPQTAAGAGQFIAVKGAVNTATVLPAGGTWVYFLTLVSSAGALLPANGSTVVAGIAAGGATMVGAEPGYHRLGFAWRIS